MALRTAETPNQNMKPKAKQKKAEADEQKVWFQRGDGFASVVNLEEKSSGRGTLQTAKISKLPNVLPIGPLGLPLPSNLSVFYKNLLPNYYGKTV